MSDSTGDIIIQHNCSAHVFIVLLCYSSLTGVTVGGCDDIGLLLEAGSSRNSMNALLLSRPSGECTQAVEYKVVRSSFTVRYPSRFKCRRAHLMKKESPLFIQVLRSESVVLLQWCLSRWRRVKRQCLCLAVGWTNNGPGLHPDTLRGATRYCPTGRRLKRLELEIASDNIWCLFW